MLLAALLSCAPQAAQSVELFDGATLAGWQGDSRFWSVEDGALVGRTTPENPGNRTTYLIHTDTVAGDFELSLEFRLRGGNSGVQFRSQRVEGDDGFQVVGYQADLEDGPNWTGCLYEQGGRGVLARRGEALEFGSQGERRSLGTLGAADELLARADEFEWNRYRIRAVGERIELAINEHAMTRVIDRTDAAREGLFALQLHAGPPMEVAFRNLVLTPLPADAPSLFDETFVSLEEEPTASEPRPASEGPTWIWSSPAAADQEEVAFERTFELPAKPARARLRGTGDNHLRVVIGGEPCVDSHAWERPFELDVAELLRVGANTLRAEARNDYGPGGMWLELLVEFEDEREALRIGTDSTWTTDAGESAVVLGPLGMAPWGQQGVRIPEPEFATPPTDIRVPEGFEVELLYSVPRGRQGSWVAMCFAPDGRLYSSDQYGDLWQTELTDDGVRVRHLDVPLGEAQGLCWAFHALYVVTCATSNRFGSGLWRVEDSDGDGELDAVRKLSVFQGASEHGPHAVIPGPDGESLYVLAGNHTKLPEPLTRSRPSNWGEDHLLPTIPDPGGHAVGIKAPGGWVAKTDREGSGFELIAIGMRNAYDMAFDSEGELFTYDSDMEWDVGLPWYRPTRILHLVSGADFGWRTGSGKWPEHYIDSLGSVTDVGLGSPTGVCFGFETNFPAPWYDKLFVCDWAYGTIHAVTLEPQGASFTGTTEPFLTGTALPVTDIASGPDGALYFTTGGRRTQSGLYRVRWKGAGESPSHERVDQAAFLQRTLRRELEQHHGVASVPDWNELYAFLGSEDRVIRHAARESAASAGHRLLNLRSVWRKDDETRRLLEVAVLLADGPYGDSRADLQRLLERLDWEGMSNELLLGGLRVLTLAIVRNPGLENREGWHFVGEVSEELSDLGPWITELFVARVSPRYPTGDSTLDRELERHLAYADAPDFAPRAIPKLESTENQADAIHLAYCLRVVTKGWTDELRARFFRWFDETAPTYQGGASFEKYLKVIREEALARVPEDERSRYLPKPKAADEAIEEAVEVVADWQRADLVPHLAKLASGRSFASGRRAYERATCSSCHRIGGAGGATGPDLTGAGARFSARDLLTAILKPSETISDQYQETELWLKNETLVVGRVEKEEDGWLTVRKLPPNEDQTEDVHTDDVETRRPHPFSRMAEGLVNVLELEELLDLMAYVLSGANAEDARFE